MGKDGGDRGGIGWGKVGEVVWGKGKGAKPWRGEEEEGEVVRCLAPGSVSTEH